MSDLTVRLGIILKEGMNMLFNLVSKVTVSAYTEVDAETLDEAIKIATQRQAAIGGVGTGTLPDETWIVDDIDGEPYDIHNDV